MFKIRLFLQILVVSICLKVLLIPAYRSTDFEVHRNWLAITSSLPLSKWYFDETSPWTLDYPPLFAYFERLLAFPAALFDANMLQVGNLGYASAGTVLFQRLSVITTEVVLLLATFFWGDPYPDTIRMVTLVAFNAGLIMVDHIHFQYNGLLLGILVTALWAAREKKPHLLAFLFTVLVLMKHLFAPLAPLVATVLLKQCWKGRNFDLLKAIEIAGIVVFIVAIAFAPILIDSTDMVLQCKQIISRLFPFGRGLVHAYWAPNIWALYYFLDKVLSLLLRKAFGFSPLEASASEGSVGLASSTSGLVGDYALHVLPRVPPAFCAFLLILSAVPPVIALWRNDDAKTLIQSFAFMTLSSFMVGYHVHEKAILVPLVVYSLLSRPTPEDRVCFITLAAVSCVSLFPLIFGAIEWWIKVIGAVTFISICWTTLHCKKLPATDQGVIAGVTTLLALSALYLDIFHPRLFTKEDGSVSMAFLPLMQVSVLCALLLLWPWAYSCLRLLVSR